MRILQIAPPWFPVPPTGYGGIEWIVSSLADGLTDLGHEVTLVANGDSETSAELVSVFDGSRPHRLGDMWMEAAHVVTAYLRASEFDIVHDHTGVIGPSIAAAGDLRVPVINTLHGPWTRENAVLYRTIGQHVALTAISHDQASRAPEGVRVAAVVHNGIELDAYPVGRQREDFLLFVGRASAEKGPEVAIEVARRTGRRLVMAMKVNEPEEHRYLAEVVGPAMRGVDVDLRTSVGNEEKSDLMMRARAVIVPIAWDEPFGLVMAEAAACGAPVIAFRRGSAPELVLDGISGRLVPPGDIAAMVDAVESIETIDPLDCRAWAEGRFSARRMVRRYLRLYGELVTRGSSAERTGAGIASTPAAASNGTAPLPHHPVHLEQYAHARGRKAEDRHAEDLHAEDRVPATTSRLIRIAADTDTDIA
jgi:glycosyltransferase involved in cell wall biosynthesis